MKIYNFINKLPFNLFQGIFNIFKISLLEDKVKISQKQCCKTIFIKKMYCSVISLEIRPLAALYPTPPPSTKNVLYRAALSSLALDLRSQ